MPATESFLESQLTRLICVASQDQVQIKQPSWLELLPILTSPRVEDINLLRNTLVRRLPSGNVLFVRAVPKSPTVTTLMLSLYSKSMPPNESEIQALKEIMSAQFQRIVLKQRKLLQDRVTLSAADVQVQEEINQKLQAHIAAEKIARRELHPAARSQTFTLGGKADDDCKQPRLRPLPPWQQMTNKTW